MKPVKIMPIGKKSNGAWIIPCPKGQNGRPINVIQETCLTCKFNYYVEDNYTKCLFQHHEETKDKFYVV